MVTRFSRYSNVLVLIVAPMCELRGCAEIIWEKFLPGVRCCLRQHRSGMTRVE